MNIQLKAIIAFILFLVISNQVLAKRMQHNNDARPQRPSFASIDANADSNINVDEFSSHKLPFGDHQTVFDSIDSDNNGLISQEEFENHKPPRPPAKDLKGNRHD